MHDLEAIGRALATRHVSSGNGGSLDLDGDVVLANYAERSRVGDWSMRAALTRFSLPEPVRSSEVLRLVRRLDAALHPLARPLAGHVVVCDRGLTATSVAETPSDPYVDTRTADLARLGVELADVSDFEALVAAYVSESGSTLDDSEVQALPLLRIAVHLDALADTLTAWANRGRHFPPVGEVDATCALVRQMMDEAGVPEEKGPRPGSRSRG